jgi:glycosyltransferase involved in cell wall biosynthesis
MRVCFVSRRYFPAISGMSVYADNLLRRLVARGHEVTMVAQYRGDAFGISLYGGGPPAPLAGVRVVAREQLGEQSGGLFERDIDDLVATIRLEHALTPFDVIHAQYGYPTGYAALLASRATGVPCVASIQGGDGHWIGSCCRTHEIALRRVLEQSDAVLIGGPSFRSEVCERLGVDPALFTLVPGAADTERFYREPGRPLGAVSDPPVLLYHGRIDWRKGALDFIEALRLLAPRAAFRAIVSGIGPDVEAVRSAIAAAQLSERVELRGYVEYADVPALYREADAFVSPTYAEGFSTTILEAMASALPIVSCRTVGVIDCLRDGENALLVEPGDTHALAAALGRLLSNQPLRARLAAAALAECRRSYSWIAVGDRIVQAYRAAASHAGRRRGDLTPLAREPCRFREAPHLI